MSFLMDAVLSFASFDAVLESEKSQEAPLQILFPAAPEVDGKMFIFTSAIWDGDELQLSI